MSKATEIVEESPIKVDAPSQSRSPPFVRFSSDVDRGDKRTSSSKNFSSNMRASARTLRSPFTRRTQIALDDPLVLENDSPESGTSKNLGHVHISAEHIFDSPRSSPNQAGVFEKTEKVCKKARPKKALDDYLPSNGRCFCGVSLSLILDRLYDLRNFVLQVKEYIPDPKGRSVVIDVGLPLPQIERVSGKPYITNYITSSRYTIYNFLPRQLLFQFSKVANLYFLVVSILQMIPGLSTTGTYTTIVPLAIFICIAMAREGYDDYKRHRMDKTENNQVTKIYNVKPDGFPQLETRAIKWMNVAVGDVLLIEKNDWIPADLILLHSEGLNGIAYIETAALDGETSLKMKRALPAIADKCHENGLNEFRGSIHSEAPNPDLYNYEGNIRSHGVVLPLTNDQIIYRGSILRNTPSIRAVVIFAGEETKIRLNASKNIRIKRPSMQSRVNRIVLVIVAFVISLSIFCTCGYYLWHSRIETRLWYLDTATQISFFPLFVSFLILFNTMVPLSLYVSMEIVKWIQQALLEFDIDLYHEASNTPAEARTSTINEELGQVSHVFSDKTGTLTDNEMVFRRISVAGHSFVHDLDVQKDAADERPFLLHRARKHKSARVPRRKTVDDNIAIPRSRSLGQRLSLANDLTNEQTEAHYKARKSTSSWNFMSGQSQTNELSSTIEMLKFMQSHPHTVFSRKARLFLLSIALCHTALPEYSSGDEVPRYSAASPDELALVTAALELGYILTDRDAHTVTLKTHPQGLDALPTLEVYKILDVIEFSSARKRMSVIVEYPDGRHCILCKGADSFLLERMRLKDLARTKWQEVEQLVNLRKSTDADRVLARRSMARPSISRPSMSGRTRLDMIRDLDHYLEERREDDLPLDDLVQRTPDHYPLRHSYAFGEATFPLERSRDLMIDERLAQNEGSIMGNTFQHLHSFASEGLRVLLYGHRFLTADEYRSWKALYHEAATSFENRQSKVERVAELIEVDLDLTGATAIEDKLQDGVPQSIEKLLRAGLKLWILTGDKRETAINIGHSAGLIKEYSSMIILDRSTLDMAGLMAKQAIQIADETIAHSVVVFDGPTLAYIEDDPGLFPSFMELVTGANTVVCCRASPAQKASLVRHVRKQVKSSITLAIGDGSNDIAMIQEAHIGIGITGREGLQAARSSDYSIAQFRFLVKLLLVHGRWNYIR